MDKGLTQRLAILRQLASDHSLRILQIHGWDAKISEEVVDGEYLVISIHRGTFNKRFALLSSSATDYAVYKRLASEVDRIFVRDNYKLDEFAREVAEQVSLLHEFPALLNVWNEESADGKFVPAPPDAKPTTGRPPSVRMLSSEEPIQAIWLRLRQFQSVSLAKKLIHARVRDGGLDLQEAIIRSKAEGVAYSLRNAYDYFQTKDVRNLSQRILNLYYGTMALATAEMLALPDGSKTLAEVESQTKYGHGLYVIDGESSLLEHLVVGPINKGFFYAWMKTLKVNVTHFPEKKGTEYPKVAATPPNTWITVENLFGSIPEIADLFFEIFQSKPRWMLAYLETGLPQIANTTKTYLRLRDGSSRFTKEDVADIPLPISEIAPVDAQVGSEFRVALTHPQGVAWQSALHLHASPFQRQALIVPLFGTIRDYRAICFALLYALSIVVRYRPSVWRLAQEGDLDYMRVLIEAFLTTLERVLPHEFLEAITGQYVLAGQPGR